MQVEWVNISTWECVINGNSFEKVNNIVNKGRNFIRSLKPILWNKSLRKETKKRTCRIMVQSVVIYGGGAEDGRRTKGNKLLAAEMDCVRKRCKKMRLGRIRKETVGELMEMIKHITGEIQK